MPCNISICQVAACVCTRAAHPVAVDAENSPALLPYGAWRLVGMGYAGQCLCFALPWWTCHLA